MFFVGQKVRCVTRQQSHLTAQPDKAIYFKVGEVYEITEIDAECGFLGLEGTVALCFEDCFKPIE